MKRAELATPKGIDHDYNYLTSIERELDNAEKNAASRGLVLEEERKKGNKLVKGEKQFNAAIERCMVVVANAPKGMTRSKQNTTICSKKNRTLKWTVEWVHPNGKKTMDKLWETQCISTAYDDHLRHLNPSRPRKKRKPDHGPREKRKPSHKHEDGTESASFVLANEPVHDVTSEGQPVESSTTAPVGKRKREESEFNADHITEGENQNISIATGPSEPAALPTLAHTPPQSEDSPAIIPAPKEDFSFYLHHPSLPSRHPVLIPLPPDAKLATALTNRLVLEFPTIYVLPGKTDGTLPEGLVSEEDFFASAKKEFIAEVGGGDTLVGGGFEGVAEERRADDFEDGEVNEGRLLEVLGKDLKDVAGSL